MCYAHTSTLITTEPGSRQVRFPHQNWEQYPYCLAWMFITNAPAGHSILPWSKAPECWKVRKSRIITRLHASGQGGSKSRGRLVLSICTTAGGQGGDRPWQRIYRPDEAWEPGEHCTFVFAAALKRTSWKCDKQSTKSLSIGVSKETWLRTARVGEEETARDEFNQIRDLFGWPGELSAAVPTLVILDLLPAANFNFFFNVIIVIKSIVENHILIFIESVIFIKLGHQWPKIFESFIISIGY